MNVLLHGEHDDGGKVDALLFDTTMRQAAATARALDAVATEPFRWTATRVKASDTRLAVYEAARLHGWRL